MAGFEPSKAFMTQAVFTEAADGLLAKAESPETDLREAIGAAQEVLEKLGDVAAEKLVVQPPLSEEQIAGYNKSASTVVSIGEKALGSLEAAESQRETAKEGDAVKGKGDEAKSTDKPTSGPDKPPTSPKPPRGRRKKS